MSELEKALDIITSHQNQITDETQIKRLQTIIEKLTRFTKGEYDHIEDLSSSEKEKNDVKNMKQFIIDEWDNCVNLRGKISAEGDGYFYNSYMEVPASFSTYMDFIKDEECWCGTCQN